MKDFIIIILYNTGSHQTLKLSSIRCAQYFGGSLQGIPCCCLRGIDATRPVCDVNGVESLSREIGRWDMGQQSCRARSFFIYDRDRNYGKTLKPSQTSALGFVKCNLHSFRPAPLEPGLMLPSVWRHMQQQHNCKANTTKVIGSK